MAVASAFTFDHSALTFCHITTSSCIHSLVALLLKWLRLPWFVRHVRIGLMPSSSFHCVQVTSRSVLCWSLAARADHLPGFVSSVSSGRQPRGARSRGPGLCAWAPQAMRRRPSRDPGGARECMRFWTLSNQCRWYSGSDQSTENHPQPRTALIGKVALFLDVCFHLHAISRAPHCVPFGGRTSRVQWPSTCDSCWNIPFMFSR